MYSNKSIRRSQLISPWGVGAIVPFPNDESLMIAGLDKWRYSETDKLLIDDERLKKRLGTHELRWPPDFRDRATDPQNFNLRIPAVRFPTWHYCPHCGTMQKSSYYSLQLYCNSYQWPNGRKCSKKDRYPRRLIPERFIVVCPDGHIDDFPVADWLHYNSGHTYDKDKCQIRRSTGGVSASLSGIFYECSCGAKKSISGATREGALAKIGYKCKGTKPWLGIEKDDTNPCGREDVRVLIRGASNVWFSETMSSIHIPKDSASITRKILNIVDEYENGINSNRVNGGINRSFIDMLALSKNVNKDELYEAFCTRIEGTDKQPSYEGIPEDEYRLAEYQVLIKSSGSDVLDFHSINFPIDYYDSLLHPYFNSISLVPKLRETRAFIGFSRLEPNEINISESKKMLRLGDEDWLPAIEVYGEGIFIEFNNKTLMRWATQPSVKARTEKLDKAYKSSTNKFHLDGPLRPEFIAIHTFSHLLINQLSYACGYGSSSLRERIYCEKISHNFDMFGVLIYTASGDSEGSLGGLVRQGGKGRIEDSILSALKKALWCSSDPICILSGGQGPDSCNLAACHNCALLPETSCENGNRLLDRGLVIGTLDNPDLGFFSNIRQEGGQNSTI